VKYSKSKVVRLYSVKKALSKLKIPNAVKHIEDTTRIIPRIAIIILFGFFSFEVEFKSGIIYIKII
jgi:hypothetical protein